MRCWLLAAAHWLASAFRYASARQEAGRYPFRRAIRGQQPMANSQQRIPQTTMFTIRLGTTITFLGALPSSRACTSGLASTAASTLFASSSMGNSS